MSLDWLATQMPWLPPHPNTQAEMHANYDLTTDSYKDRYKGQYKPERVNDKGKKRVGPYVVRGPAFPKGNSKKRSKQNEEMDIDKDLGEEKEEPMDIDPANPAKKTRTPESKEAELERKRKAQVDAGEHPTDFEYEIKAPGVPNAKIGKRWEYDNISAEPVPAAAAAAAAAAVPEPANVPETAGSCPIAVACKLGGDSKDCPFSEAEIMGYYRSAGGPQKDKYRDVITAMRTKDSSAGMATCRILSKLHDNHRTLLDWVPREHEVLKDMIPRDYLEWLESNPNAQASGKFRRASHAMNEIKQNVVCLSNDNTPNDIIKLTAEQTFIQHYFTPFANLPGLLIAHSTGAGKTAAAIATATGSWVFQGYKVAWITKNEHLFSQYTEDALKKMASAVAATLAEGDKTNTIKRRYATMTNSNERMATLKKDKFFVEPISYQTMTQHVLKGRGYTTGYAPLKIPFRNTLLIIDEVHEFVAHLYKTDMWETFKNALDESRNRKDFKDGAMVKVIALSATPMYKQPLDFFTTLYIVGGQWQLDKMIEGVGAYKAWDVDDSYKKIPLTMDALKTWLTPEGMLTTRAQTVVERSALGLVSYLNVLNDPTMFPQVRSDTWIKVRISHAQSKRIVQSMAAKNTKYYYARQAPMQGRKSKKNKNKATGQAGEPARKTKARGADENFAEYDAEYLADTPGFKERVPFLREEVRFLSPKFQTLITRMEEQNLGTEEERAAKSVGTQYKHVVYTGSPESCKQTWSLLVVNKYEPCHGTGGSVKTGIRTAAMLSKDVVVFGHKLGTPSTFQNILHEFNSPANKNGEKIKVLVIDFSIVSGISLLDVRFVHMLEPTSTSGLLLDILNQDPMVANMPVAYRDFIREELNERVNRIKAETKAPGKNRAGKSDKVDVAAMAWYELKQDFDTVAKQVLGRVTRLCGYPNLKFTENQGWLLDVTRYYALTDAPTTVMADGGSPIRPQVEEKTQMRVNRDTTVFEEIVKMEGGMPQTNLAALFLNLQLRTILLKITLERSAQADGTTTDRPHPLLGHVTQDVEEI